MFGVYEHPNGTVGTNPEFYFDTTGGAPAGTKGPDLKKPPPKKPGTGRIPWILLQVDG